MIGIWILKMIEMIGKYILFPLLFFYSPENERKNPKWEGGKALFQPLKNFFPQDRDEKCTQNYSKCCHHLPWAI